MASIYSVTHTFLIFITQGLLKKIALLSFSLLLLLSGCGKDASVSSAASKVESSATQSQAIRSSSSSKTLSSEPDATPSNTTETPSIRQQDFDLHVDGLTPYDKTNMQLTGKLTTTNEVSTDDLAKFISANLTPESLTNTPTISAPKVSLFPAWDTLGENSYQFTFSSIPRISQTQEFLIQWNGNVIGVNRQGEQALKIPALDSFQITDIRTEQLPQQSIEVAFSEPLDGQQNLIGLVTLDGEIPDVRVNGSKLVIFPKKPLSKRVKVVIQNTIQSSKKLSLANDYEKTIAFASLPPGVKFIHKGNILPPNKLLTIPVEAINTNAIYVSAFKIYANNVHYYLQRNSKISNNSTDSATGSLLWRKKIELPEAELDKKQIYNIDLGELMAKHKDGILNLSVAIDASTSLYPCPVKTTSSAAEDLSIQPYDGPTDNENTPSWFDEYYGSDNGYLSYSTRHDPCSGSYYVYNSQLTNDSRNLWLSDIGIIAKQGKDNNLHVVATSLGSGEPLNNANVTTFNYQLQEISKGKTDKNGFFNQTLDSAPFIVSVEKNNDKNFLVVSQNQALPTSQFDVGGENLKRGLKGSLYGERDLWRPGDDVFLSFIVQSSKPLPVNYPVIVDLFDSRGTKVSTQTSTTSVGNIYTFKFATQEDSPTGTWRAVARAGGEYFDLPLKIETFIPNRLKIDLDVGKSPLVAQPSAHIVQLSAEWLNGANAKKLKADVNVKLRAKKTTIKKYQQYHFDDIATQYEQQDFLAFEGLLDDKGKAQINLDLTPYAQAPGALQVTFINRVFEQSGNFSTAIRSTEFLPYNSWAGIYIEAGEGYRGSIDRESDQPVKLVTVDSDGNPIANQELTIDVYSIDWRWWWDQSADNIANYVKGDHNQAIKHDTIITDAKGKATWTLTKNTYEWGRHLVRVCQPSNQQCTGQIVYLGWSNNQNAGDAATELVLETDKDSYLVGETITLNLPSSVQGRALYSLETGTQILSQQWQEVSQSQHSIQIPVTAEMSPNAFINVALILPHANKTSDSPIRLYGITPIKVTNPSTHLHPVINVPETTRPESVFEITMSEQDGKAMNYTLAIVDEGILGVTGFNAEDPHTYFYKPEALGVKTWDVFDNVVGAYGANLERLLRIGGGDAGKNNTNKHEQRFKPVVLFEGAFSLEAKSTKVHKIKLPPYMGAVRIMVVAAKDKAYGVAQSTVKVSQPLTLLTTLPRVIGPEESLNVPVTLFANDLSVKEVKVTITADALFNFPEPTQTMSFSEIGDKTLKFPMTTANKIGKGKITVTATSGTETTQETIYLESRSPNLPSTLSEDKYLQPGEAWTPNLVAHGMLGTNTAKVTAGILPPLNLEKRLEYLIQYPHGCLEQTTSSVFPQLFLGNLLPLNTDQKAEIQKNINAALNKYLQFQLTDGAFSYWPGDNYVNYWASTYATHFLTLAKAQGYPVPQLLFNNALDALKQINQDGALPQQGYYSETLAAYPLYVLALANRPDLASMNRLRERFLKNTTANESMGRWLLASAYQLVGIKDAADQLFNSSTQKTQLTAYSHYYFGSELQELSVLLIAQNHLQLKEPAWDSAKAIAKLLNKKDWYSTHSTSFALIALAQFSQNADLGQGFAFGLKEPSTDWQSIHSTSTLQQITLAEPLSAKQLQIRNDGQQPIYVQLSNTGVPLAGQEIASANGLLLNVEFTDLNGEKLDVTQLPQGKDFIAYITVAGDSKTTSYTIEDLALTFMLPSGWQIRNERLEGDSRPENIDYQDIRDDRIHSYFSLWKNHYWYYRYSVDNHDSVAVKVILNATYAGKFYLPNSSVKAMYDEDTQATNKGMWVEVVAQ